MEDTTGTGAAQAEPQRTLEIRCTLFGSTLAAVAGALNEMATGAVLAVHTNDP